MALNEYGTLKRVAVRPARTAFAEQGRIDAQWQSHGYHGAPDLSAALAEYERFAEALSKAGAEVIDLPDGEDLTIDGIYARDALLTSAEGVILCNMGNLRRQAEPAVNAKALAEHGIGVVGAVEGEGRIEGGDFVWLDEATCAVGLTYRTNGEGVRQMAQLIGPDVEIQVVDLPHYKGPDDVFHLMSILSPLDKDLALVYSPLMPIGFRDWLQERGLSLVEVPEEEFAAMACNVLALAPRHCLMLDGCPETRRRLEAAGCQVELYRGEEISRKGEGGPTCLTRPLVRD
ncbi:MAG: arginine deiminase family protein [Pseudomonadota bacterium]